MRSQSINYIQTKKYHTLSQRDNAIHTMGVDYFRFRTLKHLIISTKLLWLKPFFLTWCIQINSKQSRETITHNLQPPLIRRTTTISRHPPTQVTEDKERKQKGKWQSAWDYTALLTGVIRWRTFQSQLSRKNLLTVCWTSYKPARPSKQPGQFASSPIPVKAAADLLWMKYELF